MKLTYRPYQLELKHRFTISGFSRTSTPLMFIELEHEGQTGYGEASMVPYMGESHASAEAFLKQVNVAQLEFPFDYAAITQYLDNIAPGNPAIKAAIDIALHDLDGKLQNKPCWQLIGANPLLMPVTSITIGIDTPEVLRQKVQEADACKVIKVKLGSANDQELINTVRSMTNKPLYADANQGWTDRQQALDLTHWLHGQGVELIEQPFKRDDRDSNAWLSARSPIPILGDEAVQRLGDVDKAAGIYNGINVKLMKSAGMHEALLMIQKARALDMKILIGCMSETSCATLAAAALAPLCDWADLDGPFLTANNPFQDPEFKDGKWILSDAAGLGLITR
ncbi:L-alanine-DL-glutamate epimerase-like enolase superfamily enzyme [Mucilaginibacter yixingensis]|uniref:Dipeptide epimerase n=1 Tax=Mucilaginibacter yixingensis TaxID=1295612 RepID=A0A2T5JD72_9SPHI|nr:dipeptide epimerase [Mucilaginibacter yixingensis]PTQ99706.1 L-alanine-DL-glutamate epimerase-like enolase superfamily enzyme [Mucilaginibacter yixingensis]